jgi:hypothetical protein
MAKTIDHRSVRVVEKAADKKQIDTGKSTTGAKAWWRTDKLAAHEAVFDRVSSLRRKQSYRSDDNLRHMRLYGGMPALGFRPGTYSRAKTSVNNPEGFLRLQLNLIKSMVDTTESKIGKSRPKPTFLTSGGNHTLQLRAKLLDKFLQGQFYEAGVYRWNIDVLKAGCVLGTGAAKVFSQDWKVCAEPVLIEEILVDDAEAIYGSPRSLFQTKAVAREVLLGDPDFADKEMQAKIKKAATVEDLERRILPITDGEGDMVDVIEAWHLPSGPRRKDGRHVICVNSVTLVDEPWTRKTFPFAFLPYARRLLGFYGEGIAERHTGRQLAINRVLKRIDDILHLCSVPRVLVEDTSKTPLQHLRNAIGDIIKYRGTKPELWVANAVPPELFQYLERLVSQGYELEGISMLSAQAKKPAGLDSAPSQREFIDIEDTRLVALGQRWEWFHLDLGRLFIEETKALEEKRQEAIDKDEDVPEYAVRYHDRHGLEELKWSDVQLEEDEYVMQMFPTSSLPTTPAARKAAVQDMWQAGWIDARESRRLLDFPDLEQSSNVAFAAYEDIEAQLVRITEKGEYEPPEPYQDLNLAIPRFQSEYLRCRAKGLPEKRLEMLRKWMDAAKQMLDQEKADAAPPPPSAGVLPAPGAGMVQPGMAPQGTPVPMQ